MRGRVCLWLALLGAAGRAAISAATGLTIPPAIRNAFRFDAPGNIGGMGFDSAGNLYLAGVSGISIGDISPPVGTTIIGSPTGIALFVMKISTSREQILHLTVIGGSFAGNGFGAMAVDANGDVFLAGGTNSSAFPTTPNSFQPSSATGGAFLLKLDPSGTKLIYSTYIDHGLTPRSLGTTATAIAIDPTGNAYIAGNTDGATFPTTEGAYQRSVTTTFGAGNTGFVSKFDPAGKLLASTLFGAPASSDNTYTSISSIAVDSTGAIHICGATAAPDFPVTPDPPYTITLLYMGGTGFLARLNPSASKLLFSTPLPFLADAIGVDAAGDSYVAGSPTVCTEPFAPGCAGAMAEISAQGKALYYDANAPGNTLIVRNDGAVIVAGTTTAPDFPTRDSLLPCGPNIPQALPSGVAFPTLNGNGEVDSATLTVLDASGNLTFATLLGGPGATVLNAMALDPGGNLYIAGGSVTAAEFPGGPVIDGALGQQFVFKIGLSAVPHGSPAPTCLVDSANLSYAPAAPSMLATLFGSNLGPATGVQFQLDANGRVPTQIAGVSVTVGGIPAPILYAQDSQINFVVPQQVTGPTTDVCVTSGGVQSCLFAFVTPNWPAVFCVGPCNYNIGFAVLNQDGTINLPGQGAAPGSVIMIFGTGLGLFDRSLADGSIVNGPLANLTTQVGADFVIPSPTAICFTAPFCPPTVIPAAVLFAGAAPQEVLGVDQVNVLIPEGVVSGLAVPLWLEGPAFVVPAKLTVTIQ